MKKGLALMLCLLLLLCACGGKKSSEAVKAEELIQAIGQVDLENEIPIKVARAYYDTLTETQRSQVETYDALLEAEMEWDRLSIEKAAEEQARKEGERNAELYAKAVEYDELNMIDKAYEQYTLLPDDYEDVQARKEAIAPYVGICGTWICDVQLAKAKNGKEWRPLFSRVRISLIDRTSNFIQFQYDGLTTTVDSKHMLYNKIDMTAVFLLDKGWFSKCTIQADGSRVSEERLVLSSKETDAMYVQLTFKNENQMLMTVKLNNNIIDVSFPYTKSN